MKTWMLASVLLLWGSSTNTSAQNDKEAAEQIRMAALDSSQIMEILFYLTDAVGPRLTNSTGYIRASQWAVQWLKEEGFRANLEPYGEFGRGWNLKAFHATMTNPYVQPLIAFPKAWSPGTSGDIRGQVVHISESNLDDVQKQWEGKLRNKILLLGSPSPVKSSFEPFSTRLSDSALVELAQDPGGDTQTDWRERARRSPWYHARVERMKITTWLDSERPAVILEGGDSRGKGSYGTVFVQQAARPVKAGDDPFSDGDGTVYGKRSPLHAAQIVVATEQFNAMARMAEHGLNVEVECRLDVDFLDNAAAGYNVVAEWSGSDRKDEVVMVGAHLDSWQSSTGATDNAANCATIMEALRILKKLGVTPRRTVRLVLWTGEEQGLFGSKGYVARHFGDRENKKPEYDRLKVYFNLDNGVGQIRGIYAQNDSTVTRAFQSWFQPFYDWGTQTVSLKSVGSTDHDSFQKAGLPGFQFIQDPLDYDTRTHHSNMDNYDRVIPQDVRRNAAIVAYFLWKAANPENDSGNRN